MKNKSTLSKGFGVLAIVAVVAVLAIGGLIYGKSVSKDKDMMMKDGEEKMMKDGEMMDDKMMKDGEEKKMMKEGEMMDDKDKEMMMKEEPKKDEMMKEMDDKMMKDMMKMSFMFSGNLLDVTEGKVVRGLNTGGNASGVAQSDFTDGVYNMYATFENLPAPQGDDFYEGWIVRTGANFSVLSSGKLEMMDGVYTNSYSSGEDLTDHAFYVLTIEPNDGMVK